MSKTFTSRNDGMKNNIVVKSSGGGVHLTVTNHDLKQFGCDISSPDAPALALAVLESAQGDPAAMDADIAEAVQELRKYVYAREEAAKEAADREALERRRDEVAKELGGDTISYKMCGRAFQNAIDRIIELEAKS